jgi:hypothetical protein
MRLNNGLGRRYDRKTYIVTYNKSDDVEAKFKCSEKITAVQHGDGISFGSSPIL